MNKERMLQLADYIENLPTNKFDMTHWLNYKSKNELGHWVIDRSIFENQTDEFLMEPLDCGTVCCIAGWATAIESNFEPIAIVQYNITIEQRAKDWLGLTDTQADNLFMTNINTVWLWYYEKCNFLLNQSEDRFYDITNKEAALVLRDIANGVTNIDEDISFCDVKTELEELGYYDYA